MKILLTGASSGVGKELFSILSSQHTVDAPLRSQLDLSNIDQITGWVNQSYDVLIHCAGTGIGGKIDFLNHESHYVKEILQTNFLSVVLLSQQVLKINPECKIIIITSTNNNRYWPNDLAYSLSKKSLEIFGQMLLVECPHTNYLEVRLGLTKTDFNNNRYKENQERFSDIYSTNDYLESNTVAQKIVDIIFDNRIKFIEISP